MGIIIPGEVVTVPGSARFGSRRRHCCCCCCCAIYHVSGVMPHLSQGMSCVEHLCLAFLRCLGGASVGAVCARGQVRRRARDPSGKLFHVPFCSLYDLSRDRSLNMSCSNKLVKTSYNPVRGTAAVQQGVALLLFGVELGAPR